MLVARTIIICNDKSARDHGSHHHMADLFDAHTQLITGSAPAVHCENPPSISVRAWTYARLWCVLERVLVDACQLKCRDAFGKRRLQSAFVTQALVQSKKETEVTCELLDLPQQSPQPEARDDLLFHRGGPVMHHLGPYSRENAKDK